MILATSGPGIASIFSQVHAVLAKIMRPIGKRHGHICDNCLENGKQLNQTGKDCRSAKKG